MNISKKTTALIGSAPSDLMAMYDGGKLVVFPDSRINVMDWKTAFDYTQKTISLPIFRRMKLWVLDDANDSNPFCYITTGPCVGKILHMCHDDGARIAFDKLGDFINELRRLGEADQDIDDIRGQELKLDLASAVDSLMNDGCDDAIEEMLIYLHVCADLSPAAKQTFVKSDDLFIREEFAKWLNRSTNVTDIRFSDILIGDKFPQVANPAKKALNRFIMMGKVV